jgi:hypothetical protein
MQKTEYGNNLTNSIKAITKGEKGKEGLRRPTVTEMLAHDDNKVLPVFCTSLRT